MDRQYDTALRPYMHKRLEEIQEADILVGIPCFNNEDTITHVARMVSQGIFQYYPHHRAVIMIADGGSTDDSRDRITELQLKPWQEKLVTIYRGIGGKGTALRAVFEAAHTLNVKVCACVDSDLRSINPDWVKYLLDPVLEKGFEFVAPIYSRYKYDGTITNNIVYNLVRSLYGKRIRQPIGGDFAFSSGLAKHYLEQDVWGSDIARFGIDVWMTTNALMQGAKVCQANLGVKIHDAKDPAAALGPMFRQVCGTLFALMGEHEKFWMGIDHSDPVPVFGMEGFLEPQPVKVNQPRMVREFKEGMRLFAPLWKGLFSAEVFGELEKAARLEADQFAFPVEVWAKLVYELAAKYHHLEQHRMKMLSVMTPLYLARVASFINRTREMDSLASEQVVEEQARVFEDQKPYLRQIWNNGEHPGELEKALAAED
ncbi:MAG: glycosyltransferase [Deltaproteobacteria bacterium]|nr:glycosyltransferase [Candidatus Anaeroferrophillus wilburensis]MBN2887988.1 glycosyltransferase [Deltaproteobacteria bacterium]